jgi:predicted unusual protein kinase regulating ubiquinone biosynthesis (AarF/ABC1/UbiB family)
MCPGQPHDDVARCTGGTTVAESPRSDEGVDTDDEPTFELDEAQLDALWESVPRVFPRELPPTPRREVLARAREIAFVASRNFAPLALKSTVTRNHRPDAYARPLRKTFEELGATFMKFGQLVGSSPGVFGESVAAEFRSCLDTGKPVPFDEVRRAVEADLGMPLDEAFWSFSETPIGRASISVVHKATTRDGRRVAVKVLRPGIERRVATDLDLFQPLLDVVAKQTGEYAAGQLLSMFQGFRVQIGEELDLRNEARAMQHYRQLLQQVHLPRVTVPEVFPELSGPRVLTMEFLDGVAVDDLTTVAGYGYDPGPVVQEVIKGFLLTAIRWGTFHGDVHAGNLLLLPDGRVGVIDWGIVGRLDPETHRFFRLMIEAALGNEDAWPDIASLTQKMYGPVFSEQLGMDHAQVEMFMRMAIEPVLTQPFGEVSLADLLTAPQRRIAEAKGLEANELTLRAVYRRFREQRRVRAALEAHGAMDSDFDRSVFLLSKQLVYFERYGKIFLKDVSLFEDAEFFRAALDAPTTAERS